VKTDGGREPGLEQVDRREAVKLLVAIPIVLSFGSTLAACERAARSTGRLSAADAFRPTFFTAHEYETVRILADQIIPRDERSGSASDAKVPEFIDFMLADPDTAPEGRTAMRDGLAWIDAESRRRFNRSFAECPESEQTVLLDDIAWPARAKPEMQSGVSFFNRFRDLTASGFWSSEMGVRDLRYRGNAIVPEWKGCPDAALRKLGVRYEDHS
jgi:gluconate 2-dehydrogenase gamma chain